ncbi:ROK family protein [Salmonella enterica subsp. enterica]|nr:ROK family protein [Salmonella enterica subsp. enterica]
MWRGVSGQHYDNLVCITIGTGIGGVRIVGRKNWLIAARIFTPVIRHVMPVGNNSESNTQIASTAD